MERTGATAGAWDGLGEGREVLRGWLARRCAHDSEVDDVVQETLLRAARYRGGLADDARLAGWALAIAANTLRDRRRLAQRWCVSEDGGLDLESLAVEPESHGASLGQALLTVGGRRVSCEDALEHLRAALASLRPCDARLLLEFYGGVPTPDIAQRLGVGRGAVKCRLYRARRSLTRMMERRIAREHRASEACA